MSGGTPADKWRQMVTEHKERCRRMVDSSPHVRYAGAINRYGRTLTGARRHTTRPLMRPEDARNEFFVASGIIEQRRSTSARLGAFDHAVLVHAKVYVVLLRRAGVMYYVSVEKGAGDLDGIVRGLKRAASRRA